MLATRRCDGVEPRAPVVLRDAPFRCHPPAVLEAAEGGVERALLDAEDVAGGVLDPAGHGVAVRGSEEERLEDENGERSLEQVALVAPTGHPTLPGQGYGKTMYRGRFLVKAMGVRRRAAGT